jgi:YbbR domain-containing protein
MKRLIKEYLLENWSLKATAILLALILWLFIQGEPGQQRGLAIPLEVLVPRNMEITNERPMSAEITYRGPAFSNIGSAICIIDLKSAKEGKHTISLTSDNVRMPKGLGIEILQINPARVTLVLEQTVSKEVPIIASMRGEPLQGIEIYGMSSAPASVILTGPRSRIEPVREVATETVSIAGKNKSSQFFVNLNLHDDAIRSSVMDPIQVNIQMGPRRKLEMIKNVPVAIDDAAYITEPRQISIQILISPELISELTPEDFLATVSMKTVDTSNLPARMKPSVRLLRDWSGSVTIKNVHPPEVLIHRKK